MGRYQKVNWKQKENVSLFQLFFTWRWLLIWPWNITCGEHIEICRTWIVLALSSHVFFVQNMATLAYTWGKLGFFPSEWMTSLGKLFIDMEWSYCWVAGPGRRLHYYHSCEPHITTANWHGQKCEWLPNVGNVLRESLVSIWGAVVVWLRGQLIWV